MKLIIFLCIDSRQQYNQLTMKHHVNRVTSNCFFQLCRLRQIRRVAGPDVTKRVVSTFVLSRLDYCNAALASLPQTTLWPLQRALDAAARLIANMGSCDHITPAMKELHWLPINQGNTYKLCLMMHFIHTQQYPDYMRDLASMTATTASENWTSFDQWLLVLEARDPNEVRCTCFQLFRTCCVELATYPPADNY